VSYAVEITPNSAAKENSSVQGLIPCRTRARKARCYLPNRRRVDFYLMSRRLVEQFRRMPGTTDILL